MLSRILYYLLLHVSCIYIYFRSDVLYECKNHFWPPLTKYVLSWILDWEIAVDTVSMSRWRNWPSIINGVLGLSKVGWTYYEGILNRHIWWCLWKNIHMTLWNPFAIHQNFHLQMSNFRKSWQMTRTYRIIYTFTFLTTDFHINLDQGYIWGNGGKAGGFFNGEDVKVFWVTKPLGTSGVFCFAIDFLMTLQWI